MQSNIVIPNTGQPSMLSQVEEQARLTCISFDPVLRGNITADVQLSTSSNLRLLRPTLNGSRATGIFNASSPMYLGRDLVAKVSWPEAHRSNEATIINQAYVALSGLEVSKNLPKIYGWKDVDVSNTTEIVESLKQTGCNTNIPKRKRNPRILRLLLFRRLQPLDKVDDEDQFMRAWVDCFKCHYALWNKGIEHGDISVWNLMWDPVDKNGVLNDFDMAVIKGSSKNCGTERTGTLPFMSQRILSRSGHGERIYADDLESFIWVFASLCLRGTDIPPCKNWRGVNTINDVCSTKQSFLTSYENLKPCFTIAWGKCQWLLLLLYVIGSFTVDWKVLYHLSGDPFSGPYCVASPNDIYLEILKAMETDYKRPDILAFTNGIRNKIALVAEKVGDK